MVKKDLNRVADSLGGAWLRNGAAWYLIAYVVMQKSGFFGSPYIGFLPILHRWPALAGVAVLMAGSAAGLIAGRGGGERTDRSFLRLLISCGLLIAGTGILISSQTHFEGRLVLTEGQEGRTTKGALDPSGIYARRFSSWPQEDVAVLGVAPFFSESGKPIRWHRAEVLFRDRLHPRGRRVTISSVVPKLVNGFFYQIVNVGYSPHFLLYDSTGAVLDDAYVAMDLYPPGAEDFFRVPDAPHTFYVRYYPHGSTAGDGSRGAEGTNGPRYRVRVARNLDLLMDRDVSPFEMLPADSYVFSFQDAARWIEIKIVRDYGLYLAILGAIVMMIGSAALATGKIRDRRRGRNAAGSD